MSRIKTIFLIYLASSIFLVAGCAAPRPNIVLPQQQPPALNLRAQPRVALALGGGGARGMAHIGVIKVLEQEQIPIDFIAGCSAGSIVGALYADHRNANQVERILMQAGALDLLDFSPSLEGAVTGYGLQNFILHNTRARNFNQLRIPLVTVATNLKTGQAVYLSSGPIAPAVNASAALPPVFRPVQLYGQTLVDGGVTDLIPVDVAKRYNPEIIIAVNISTDLPKTMPTNIIGVYDRAYILSDDRFAAYNMKNADIVLHPRVGQAGTFDSADKAKLVREGEIAARQALPKICSLLREKHIHSKCS